MKLIPRASEIIMKFKSVELFIICITIASREAKQIGSCLILVNVQTEHKHNRNMQPKQTREQEGERGNRDAC